MSESDLRALAAAHFPDTEGGSANKTTHFPVSPMTSAASKTLTIDQVLQQAIGHHQVGRLQDAERLYRAILQSQPNHLDANHNMGVLAVQMKQPAAGLPYFKLALEADPNQRQFWLSYIDALIQTGDAAAAWQALDEVRQRGLSDETVEALVGRLEGASGSEPSPQEIKILISLFNEGKYTESVVIARALTDRFPRHGVGWKVLGAALKRMERKSEALAPMQKAAELLPHDAESHNNLGAILQDLGWSDKSEVSCRRALEIKSDFAEAHSNLGVALKDLGRFDDAVASCRRALEINPDHADAYSNLGLALCEFGRLDDAVASCRSALEINPNYADAHNNLGFALKELEQLDAAMASYRRALEIKPDFAEAHSNLGVVLKDLGWVDDAMASFRRALEIKPDLVMAHSNLLFCLNYHPDLSAEEVYRAYQEYDALMGIPLRPTWRSHTNERSRNRRLRVGYVSPDFRRHSCRSFLEPLLAHHDKTQVEVYAYAELAKEDDMTARFKSYVDHWIPTKGMGDEALAERIRSDGIDILVELAGHTRGNRLRTFARKPAPVSISWLGYG
jgi:tetratricopeptide (TPR) repeat protein